MDHYQHMANGVRIAIVAAAVASASTVMAPTANAGVGEFLTALVPKYVYLTPEQLLNAGYEACAAAHRGVPSTDTIDKVQHELTVSVAAAYDIVTTGITTLEC
jgi:hypothetical protein